MLSVIIPSYNEEDNILKTACVISKLLDSENIDYELIETTIPRQGSAAEPLTEDGTFRIGNGSIITVRFKNKNEPDDRRAFQTFADNRVTYE